ncbi:MAG: HNH endonuclease [Allomuricauda sp.]
MAKKNWSREEHIVAFNLYCKVPFTKINSSNKAIQELAPIIGRSVGAVTMKLANFVRLDPDLQKRNISGLTQGAKGEEEVWEEFNGNWEELSWQSEKILAKLKGQSIESTVQEDKDDLILEGKEKESIVKTRVNQSFFRKTVLASYNFSCCITGISIQDLLIASHIIPWSRDNSNRVNPANGLCLNSFHDKAFDRGLITVTPDYRIKTSQIVTNTKDKETSKYFLPYDGQKIKLPQKFYPDVKFLKWHNDNIFRDQGDKRR